jgi:hypothetical protein
VAGAADTAISTLAGRQRGYVTRAQLLGLGLSPDAIDYRLKIGRLIPVHTGVYAVGHLPITGADRAFAAVLACGPGAVLSHGTAACWWGIDQRWRTPFEVIVKTARRRPGIRTHRAVLTRRDVRRHNGIRVTSPARTILDIAPRLTEKALRRAVNELRSRDTSGLRISPTCSGAIQRAPAPLISSRSSTPRADPRAPSSRMRLVTSAPASTCPGPR